MIFLTYTINGGRISNAPLSHEECAPLLAAADAPNIKSSMYPRRLFLTAAFDLFLAQLQDGSQVNEPRSIAIDFRFIALR